MARLAQFAGPKAPHEIADEVELYARESGRTGSLRWVPTLMLNGSLVRGVWVVDLSLRVNDPRMQLWRDGKAEKPLTEQVWLWETNPKAGDVIPGTFGELREPPMVGLDLAQMGAAGVRQFLDRGNSEGGRGEYGSLVDALASTREHNSTVRRRNKAQAKDESRQDKPGLLRFLLGDRKVPVLSLPWKKKAS